MFWKDNASNFPKLARMARDILSCPISSVGIERTFSLARRVCRWDRAQMTPEHVEQTMMIKYYNRTMDLDYKEALNEPWDLYNREELEEGELSGDVDPFKEDLGTILDRLA